MKYAFLVDTYATERLKVLSVWSLFEDDDSLVRPHAEDPRGRSVLEQMIHQCVSEDLWFREILGIDVDAPPLPAQETRLEFLRRYALDSRRRLDVLRAKDNAWWEEEVSFFDVNRLSNLGNHKRRGVRGKNCIRGCRLFKFLKGLLLP